MTDALINSIEINKNKKGFTVLDVPSNKFINALASFFKEKNIIKLPKWSSLVKCNRANEIEPLSPDYLFIKAAAISRYLYINKKTTIGVGSLRTVLGKKMRRGSQPSKFSKAGGKTIREVIKQLKQAGYLENYRPKEENITFGLVLTKTGRTELDKIASKLMKKN